MFENTNGAVGMELILEIPFSTCTLFKNLTLLRSVLIVQFRFFAAYTLRDGLFRARSHIFLIGIF